MIGVNSVQKVQDAKLLLYETMKERISATQKYLDTHLRELRQQNAEKIETQVTLWKLKQKVSAQTCCRKQSPHIIIPV